MKPKTPSKTKLIFFIAILLNAYFAKAQQQQVTLTINPAKTYQTISNFGASDAWACQFVGNWPDEKKNKIADWLFSNDTYADGSPKGIGLSIWRFNMGAGSAEQGEESGIKDEWRRAESFLNADGSYNWDKQAGQVWFLNAAKKRGVKQFLAFVNSPPVQFTVNGKAYASNGKVNIAPNRYDDFARYIAAFVKGIEKKNGIKFNYISPVNEPQWDWSDAGQEGCPYLNTEVAGVVKALNKAFVSNNIDSKIVIGEAGSINYLFAKGDKPGKGDQIKDFFKPGSPNYIGDLPAVAKAISAHSYFTTSPLAFSVKVRGILADSIAKISGLEFWQSEYCILGNNAGEIDGNHRDLGIDAALYLASVIHTDLTVANASAWQWWTAISPYNYKDGLIYIDKNKTDGNFYSSKMLWALGNYSRFIKPGSIRIEVAAPAADPKSGLQVSGFKNGKNITLVIVNKGREDIKVSLNSIGVKTNFTAAYITSQNNELTFTKMTEDKLIIKARSIVTLSGKLR